MCCYPGREREPYQRRQTSPGTHFVRRKNFLSEIKAIGEKNPTGHIFHDRGSLPDRVREQVRKACKALGIPCLGRIEAGADDDQALLDTSIQLGHNRKEVTIQSYIPPQDRRI